MGTDVNLELFGTRLRVVCDTAPNAEMLRSAMRDHVIAESADLGFVIRAPADHRRLYLVLDRSGLVLGRTASSTEAVVMLSRHLASFLPPPPNTVRLRARLLVKGAFANLAGWPLFTDIPVVERRLERIGFRIVDRLIVDLRRDGAVSFAPSPWRDLAEQCEIAGHASVSDGPFELQAVMVPQVTRADPSRASVIAFLAGTMIGDADRHDRLDLAEVLSALPIRPVGLDDRAARYQALEK